MAAGSLWGVMTLLLGYAVFCVVVWQGHRRRVGLPLSSSDAGTGFLVTYASQGGTAERIARQSAEGLSSEAQTVTLLPLNRLDDQVLRRCKKALFVVSTYGEGEPPDNGVVFARRYLGRKVKGDWADVNYGVLALGDRQYTRFCAFGQQLHQGLARNGARALFEPVLVDREDVDALAQWQHLLNKLGANLTESLAANDDSPFAPWRLQSRQLMNAGSPGASVFFLRFVPADDQAQAMDWLAGDIAQIRLPDGKASQRRDYSIASLPDDGVLELVVRQHRYPDGGFGLGSGCLTHHLPLEGDLHLRVRSNPAFHSPPPEQPMILIGNGTGIAGLRAHLKAREKAGAHRNWLIFGERTAACDRLFQGELEGWLRAGHLQRLDRTFSRDGTGPRYVQHALKVAMESVRHWLKQGACIYICGSRQGMAVDVDDTLRQQLGDKFVDQLLAVKRYCRDIY